MINFTERPAETPPRNKQNDTDSPSLSNEHRRSLISRYLASERSYAPKHPDDLSARAVVAALHWLDDPRALPPSSDEIDALGTLAAAGDPAIRALEELLEPLTNTCTEAHEREIQFPALDTLVASVLTCSPRDAITRVEQVLAQRSVSPSDDGGQAAIDHLRELAILVESVRAKLRVVEPLGRALTGDPRCLRSVFTDLALATSPPQGPSHSYQVMRSDGSTTTVVAKDLQDLHKILETQRCELVIDDVRRSVLRSGVRILDLQRSPMLHQILILLGSQPNRAISKEAIVRHVWNLAEYHPLRDAARVHTSVSRLRKLLAAGMASSEETGLLQNATDGYCLRVPSSFLMIRETSADQT